MTAAAERPFRGVLREPMTRDHLLRLLARSVLGLALVAVAVVVLQLCFPRQAEVFRSVVPIAIAIPGALFAFAFPLRIQHLREYENHRQRGLNLLEQLIVACEQPGFGVDRDAFARGWNEVSARLVELGSTVTGGEKSEAIYGALDTWAEFATRLERKHPAALTLNGVRSEPSDDERQMREGVVRVRAVAVNLIASMHRSLLRERVP